MKNTYLLLLAATSALPFFVPSSARAQIYMTLPPGRAEQKLISMTGSAEIKVVPDLVDLRFEVLVRNHDFATARKDETDRANRVLAALRAAGVKEEELRASQPKISTVYNTRNDRDNRDSVTVDYYQLAQDFGCTLHDPSQVADVTAAVIAAGATGVGEAELRTSQLRKYRDEARHKAAVAAKEKAAALVAEIGRKLGEATGIREDNYSYGRPQFNNSSQNVSSAGGSGASADDSTFAPGMISVGASVDVTYVIE